MDLGGRLVCPVVEAILLASRLLLQIALMSATLPLLIFSNQRQKA